MAVDLTRIAFLTREYAYESATDNSVKAKYRANAREIVLQTNLTAGAAATFAAAYLAATKEYSYAFDAEIEGVLYLEDFQDSPPRYTVSFPGYPAAAGRVFRVLKAESDYLANTTMLRIKS